MPARWRSRRGCVLPDPVPERRDQGGVFDAVASNIRSIGSHSEQLVESGGRLACGTLFAPQNLVRAAEGVRRYQFATPLAPRAAVWICQAIAAGPIGICTSWWQFRPGSGLPSVTPARFSPDAPRRRARSPGILMCKANRFGIPRSRRPAHAGQSANRGVANIGRAPSSNTSGFED